MNGSTGAFFFCIGGYETRCKLAMLRGKLKRGRGEGSVVTLCTGRGGNELGGSGLGGGGLGGSVFS